MGKKKNVKIPKDLDIEEMVAKAEGGISNKNSKKQNSNKSKNKKFRDSLAVDPKVMEEIENSRLYKQHVLEKDARFAEEKRRAELLKAIDKQENQDELEK